MLLSQVRPIGQNFLLESRHNQRLWHIEHIGTKLYRSTFGDASHVPIVLKHVSEKFQSLDFLLSYLFIQSKVQSFPSTTHTYRVPGSIQIPFGSRNRTKTSKRKTRLHCTSTRHWDFSLAVPMPGHQHKGCLLWTSILSWAFFSPKNTAKARLVAMCPNECNWINIQLIKPLSLINCDRTCQKAKNPLGKQSLADQQTTSRVTNHPYFQYEITIFSKSLKKNNFIFHCHVSFTGA